MEAFPVFDAITVQSQSGPYEVIFSPELFSEINTIKNVGAHFIIDKNIAKLYSKELAEILNHPKALIVEATENNKSIERVIDVINRLVENKVRRGQVLIAVGGGIIQDIACFIAGTLLRGMEWSFIPTTLLAQADSCIGSKSSINLGALKNILGTFNPPKRIWICPSFLDTLEDKEIQSGIGEILKVHVISGQEKFSGLKQDFDKLFTDRSVLLSYVRASLLIKQKYIEIDEFDKGVRNIFNYGHSFGHAIESATNFAIPHGVAVSIGMDMANHIAFMRDLLPEKLCDSMHSIFHRNYKNYKNVLFSLNDMLSALKKDKKNTSTKLTLIFPIGDDAKIKRVEVSSDEIFVNQCKKFIEILRS